MPQNLKIDKKDAVATIELYRPQKKNSLNGEMRGELEECLKELARDRNTRVVIVTGGEEIFCAGADISEIQESVSAEAAYHHAREFQLLFDLVEALPQPVIAAVSGYALGGGCELALACDFRIASQTAKLGLPEIKIGAFPGGGGTQRLPRLIGASKAKEMIFTGDPIGAEEALALGLVMKVVPKESASSAPIGSPVKIISLALLAPIRRGSLWVPPPPGKAPILISGRPNLAVWEAMRKSQARASSHPPPRA